MIRIYLDMDGVVANFRKEWKALSEVDPYLTLNRATMKFGVYRYLEVLLGASELVTFCYRGLNKDIHTSWLTSAHTYKPAQFHECVRQKEAWLEDRHWDEIPLIMTNCGEEKAKYAVGPDCVLIDDTPHNVNFFNEEGGTGILWKGPESMEEVRNTINRLINANLYLPT